MANKSVHTSTNSVRAWLGAHVESAVFHAAVELRLLPSLLEGAQSSAELAERYGYDEYSSRVIMDVLASLGLVRKQTSGQYELMDAFKTAFDQETMVELSASKEGWQRLASFSSSAYNLLLKSAQEASLYKESNRAQLLEHAWKYVWSAGIVELGKHNVFSVLDDHACSLSELATSSQLSEEMLSQLCIAGQHTGMISLHDALYELTQEARLAFGKGSMRDYCRWMEQRFIMDHDYFFAPLGEMSHCVLTRQPASLTSSLGDQSNKRFRQTFVRINRPLIPLLYHVAQKVASALAADQQPLRILEVGAGLGCWGIALAGAHRQSHIVAVDTAEVLIETQRVAAAAKVEGQYTWLPGDMRHIKDLEQGDYDLIILNEICHTVSSLPLATWLNQIVARLAPKGTLLIADMVLDETYQSPFRHLLSAAKLFVTGGGRVLSINQYQQLLQGEGLEHIQLYRLATTDLIVAKRSNFSLPL